MVGFSKHGDESLGSTKINFVDWLSNCHLFTRKTVHHGVGNLSYSPSTKLSIHAIENNKSNSCGNCPLQFSASDLYI